MPTLYRLSATASQIGEAFAASAADDPWAGGMVSPQTFAPVVTTGREFVAGPRPPGDPPRRLIPRLWGVPPPRSVADAARPVLTVRNIESPFWIGNLRNSEFRCLVPASAFMVWGRGLDREGKRRKHWFACADQPLFAFAGVWMDSEVPSFAIVTCAPNAALREVGREAMPAVLPPDPAAHHVWLNGGWDRASALLEPYSSSMMREV